MTGVRGTVTLCLVFIAVVVGMFVYSTTRTVTLSVEELGTKGVVTLDRPRDIVPFALTTAEGKPFSNASLLGNWTFIFFGFTNCPDICPVSMSVMAQAEQRLRADDAKLAEQFQGVLVSVDPERDTPEVLGPYVQAFSKKFVGVYGSRELVAAFAQQLNATFAKVPDGNGGYQMDHTGTIAIINPKGHYHGFIKMPHKADVVAMAFRSYATDF